mgnify:CR=1 FL=1
MHILWIIEAPMLISIGKTTASAVFFVRTAKRIANAT